MFGSLLKLEAPRVGWVLWLTVFLLPGFAAAQAGTLTRAPELTNFVQAPYPAQAEAEGREGAVVLLVTIEADGSVSAVEVETPAGHGFDEAAVAAAQQFVFRPAEIDGAPAAVQIAYRYAFELQPAAAEVPSAAPTGALEVQLRQRGDRRPLVGITVRAGGREAISDAKGRARFDALPAGSVKVLVRDPSLVELEDEETVRAGEVVTVIWSLDRAGFSTGLEAVARRPAKEVTRRTLSVQEIRTVPGTNGDALRVVQNLPGVARAPFGLGGLVLRGGGQSQAYLQGHPIPTPFHFGLRSVVSSALIESIDLYPGNQSPAYGRGNGGVVDVRLRKPGRDGWHGYGEFDVFDAGFFLEAPVGERGGLAVGGRRSYIDALLPLFLTEDQKDAFPVAPRYYDYQAVYDQDLDGGHGLRLMAFGGGDRTVFIVEEPSPNDPSIRGEADLDLDWVGGQAEWRWRGGDLRHSLNAGYIYEAQRGQFGPDLRYDYDLHRFTVRDALTARATDWLEIRAGLDVEVAHTTGQASLPRISKEGETAPPVGASPILATQIDETNWLPAAWTEVAVRLGPVTLMPGLRLDYFEPVEALAVQPRLTSRWQLSPATTLKGGVGLYTEQPDDDELDPVFGTPGLDLEKSVHVSLGVEQRLGEFLTVDLTGFYKDFSDLVTRSEGGDVGEDTPAYRNQGDGRAYGAELLLRHQGHGRFYGWLAYTLMRSERQDVPGTDWRPFSSDQTHNLTLVANYKLTSTWELGLRWRYVTGNPTTPIVGASFDSDGDTYVPKAGVPNSDRLAAFHQLDVRVDKHWIFDDWRLTTYLDVQNTYLRANPEGQAYNFNYTDSSTIGGLPLVPSFGVRGSF